MPDLSVGPPQCRWGLPLSPRDPFERLIALTDDLIRVDAFDIAKHLIASSADFIDIDRHVGTGIARQGLDRG